MVIVGEDYELGRTGEEMNTSRLAIVLGLVLSATLPACRETIREYTRELSLGKTIEFRPRRLPTGGATSNHPCIQGSYNHVYETDYGQYGQREVWLCCVPVDEILRESFNCGESALSSIYQVLGGGDSDYWKIRSCYLQHPTATEPTFIPVCIPAPLSVEPRAPR